MEFHLFVFGIDICFVVLFLDVFILCLLYIVVFELRISLFFGNFFSLICLLLGFCFCCDFDFMRG